MPEVHEINAIDQLSAYRAAWQSLLQRTEGASFFHSLDWLETYWRHFGREQKLRVLVVASAGAPQGIVPLVVRRERTRIGSVRVLTYPLDDWASFYGPLGEDPRATLGAGLAHVRRTPRDWDLLELRWADASAPLGGATEQAMRAAGFQTHKTVWDRTALIDLQGDWDDYWKSRPAKWRANVGRAERRLTEQGRLSYVRYRPAGEAHGDGDPRWDLYDACEELARRSWQGSSATGTTLSHEAVRPFFRDAHAAAARWGAVDLNLLLLDDRPAAFAYNYHFRGSVYGLRIGFDRDFSRQGLGNVLSMRIIQDSFSRGDRLYDLGVGYLKSKEKYLTRLAPILRYSHFPLDVPRAQLLRLKRWVQSRGG